MSNRLQTKMTNGKRSLNLTESRNGKLSIISALGDLLLRAVLALVFFLIVTPIGVVMRLLGRDAMRCADKSDAVSCRVISKNRDKNHVRKPY